MYTVTVTKDEIDSNEMKLQIDFWENYLQG